MGVVALNHGFYQKAINAFSNYLDLQNIPSLKRIAAKRYLRNSEFGIHAMEKPLDISPKNINWNQNPENYPDSYFFQAYLEIILVSILQVEMSAVVRLMRIYIKSKD